MKSKYTLRTIAALIGYAMALVALKTFYAGQSTNGKYWLALVPLLPLVYMATSIVRSVADLDEMKRKIYTEAMAFAGVATAFTCFTYLFIRDMGAPEFRAEWAFYITWAYYFIGAFFSWRRYR